MPTPIEAMRIVAARLEAVDVTFAFVGGAVVAVLVDDPELTEVRPTKDVDVIVEITTLVDYYALEERLRDGGFKHDTTEGAPICRWIIEGCRVDVMPTTSAALGMNSRWFPEALAGAQSRDLGEGLSAMVITPALFLATKLEAFHDRGRGDYYASHDLEDIITLVDGHASIIDDVAVASASVRDFVGKSLNLILQQTDFRDAFPGHLSALSRDRAPLVWQRLKTVGALSQTSE